MINFFTNKKIKKNKKILIQLKDIINKLKQTKLIYRKCQPLKIKRKKQ